MDRRKVGQVECARKQLRLLKVKDVPLGWLAKFIYRADINFRAYMLGIFVHKID